MMGVFRGPFMSQLSRHLHCRSFADCGREIFLKLENGQEQGGVSIRECSTCSHLADVCPSAVHSLGRVRGL